MSRVSDLIDAAMVKGDEADPHVIARRLLRHLTQEERDDMVLRGLAEEVALRQRAVRAEVPTAAPGPSRWSQVKREVAPFVNKFLDECTLDDLRQIVYLYDEQISRTQAVRERYAKLLAEMLRTGAETVADLEAVAA